MADSHGLLVTCEHGGNRVPAAYRALFRTGGSALESHRGYDLGALELSRRLAALLRAPLLMSTTTRLLVDLNRSLHHRRLFSEFTASLRAQAKQEIIDKYYEPHRAKVTQWIDRQRRRPTLHLAVHSFTPVLDGQGRRADVGFLFDSRRRLECHWVTTWRKVLQSRRPDLRVRRNYPYLGRADGFPPALRRRFPDEHYAAIELEVNQQWAVEGGAPWRQLLHDLAESLRQSLDEMKQKKFTTETRRHGEVKKRR